MADVYSDFKKWCEDYGLPPSIVIEAYHTAEMVHKQYIMRETVEKNKFLVGKFFKTRRIENPKERRRYIKIISARAADENMVSCLTFTEHPVYKYTYADHKFLSTEPYCEGVFNFPGIFTNCELVRNFTNDEIVVNHPWEEPLYEEISEREYMTAFDNWCHELMHMKWLAPDEEEKDEQIY